MFFKKSFNYTFIMSYTFTFHPRNYFSSSTSNSKANFHEFISLDLSKVKGVVFIPFNVLRSLLVKPHVPSNLSMIHPSFLFSINCLVFIDGFNLFNNVRDWKIFLYKHKKLIIFVHPIDKVHVSYFDLLYLPIEHFNPKSGLLLNILLIPI